MSTANMKTKISGKSLRRQQIKEGWAGRIKAFAHILHDRAHTEGRSEADWNAWCEWDLWRCMGLKAKGLYMQTRQRWLAESKQAIR